jgi:hypothetical protein
MKKHSLPFPVFLLVTAVLVTALLAGQARADGVTITMAPISLTIPEGSEIGDTFTITNNSATDSIVPKVELGSGPVISGDPTDFIVPITFGFGTCPIPGFSGGPPDLAPGASCSFIGVWISPGPDPGSENGDFGVSPAIVSADYDCGSGTCNTVFTFDVTVTDPVPEPSSALLLGVGLASIVGFMWRRKWSNVVRLC